MNENRFEEALRSTLRRIFIRTLALRFFSGFLAFLATASWTFLIVIVLSHSVSEPSLAVSLLISRAFWVLLSLFFLFFVVVPVLRIPGIKRITSEVEHRRDFKDIVMAAYEFSQDPEAKKRYNPGLIEEVIRRAVESIAPLKARFLFLETKQMIFIPLAYGGLIVVLLLALSKPEAVMNAGGLLARPSEAAAVEHRANILVSPGDVTVLAGSDVEVRGVDFGGTKRPVSIRFSRGNGFWKSEPAEKSVTTIEGTKLNQYSFKFENLRSSLSYYFQAGGDNKSDVYEVRVVNKPIVTDLRIIRMPPAYTGSAADTLLDSGGNVQALEGTRLRIEGRCNNELRRAEVLFDQSREGLLAKAKECLSEDELSLPASTADKMRGLLSGELEIRDREFNFELKALKEGFYTILLQDTSGYKNDDPLLYSIEVFSDDDPSIEVLEPGGDATMPRNYRLKVTFTASDDYGVNEAALFYRKGTEGPFEEKKLPLKDQRGRKEITETFMWEVEGVTLFPGNVVEYYLEIRDNNVVTGPGVAKSRIYQLTMPTMAELYESVAEEDAMRNEMLEESLKEGEELKKRIEKLAREFAKTERFDWSQKKELDKALESGRQIEEKLEEVQSSLDKTLQQLADNKMTSQEIGEKMEEISELLEEIKSEALDRYLEDLQKAMTSLTPEQVKEALKNMQLSAEDLLKRLERTAELLKAIRKEQEMEELVRKSREMMEKQKDILDETASSSSDDKAKMNDLSKRQEELARQAAAMKQAVEKFADKLGAEEKDIADKMKASADRLSQNDLAGVMKSAAENLKSGNKSEAMEDEKQALEDLISLFANMSESRSSMGQMAMRRQGIYLQRFARKTLGISFKEEELLEELRDAMTMGSGNGFTRRLAERQNAFYKATEKVADALFELSKQSMAISPFLLQVVGQALDAMNNVVMNLEQNKPLYSLPSANKALEALNLATIEMLRAAKSCSSCSNGGMGMQDLLEKLLSGQKDIMEQSKELLTMEMLKEKLRMERQAKMRRLAGAQRALEDLARQIERQMKENKSTLGRMDKVIEEMEKVIKDLESGTFDRKTLDHEERILSRLLDAQRSIHTRDYERKRRSETAGDVFSRTSGTLSKKDKSAALREEIRRAMKLKAPGEFEELIRYYFRALAEESSRLEARKNRGEN